MNGPWLFFLSVALPAGALAAEPAIAPADFQEWFATGSEGRLHIPESIEKAACGFRYVFISGFRNEGNSGYFAQNAKELRARGVPREFIAFIDPSSDRTIQENAADVRARIRAFASQGPEELVVIAHSRGACDALLFALENPRFVRDRVRAFFLLQGPFGGTALADFITGEGPPMGDKMPLRLRWFAQVMSDRERKLMSKGKHGGLPELAQQAAQDFWERTLERDAGAIPIVGPKVFYVTTQTSPQRLRLVKRATAYYLSHNFGPNDGIVALEDQSVPELGTVLAVIDAGHSDLTNRFPVTRTSRHLRRALTQSVMMAVGQPEPSAPDDANQRGDDVDRDRRSARSRGRESDGRQRSR